MLRRFACLVSLLAMFSGCATPQGKMIGGGVLATTGLVIAAHSADGHCLRDPGGTASDVCDAGVATPVNAMADVFTTVVGIGLIALGGGMIVSGARQSNETPPPAPIARIETPPAPVQRATTLPADIALRDRVENRLAIQASLTAHTGNCSAAITTANMLAQRDPTLHAKLLSVDAELASCYSQDVAR